MTVSIEKPLPPLTHAYETFSITLYPFRCRIRAGQLTLHEHKNLKWLSPAKPEALKWSEADRLVLEAYLKGVSNNG
jgi:8-oxo-dGTP diphosphatase